MNAPQATLRILSPLKIYFLGLSVYLALWVLSPIDFNFQGDADSVVLFFFYNLLFALGLSAGYRRKSESKTHIPVNKKNILSLINTISWLGSIGLLIRCFERIFIRSGGAISTDFIANREMISAGGSGSIALIGSLLSSFLYFPRPRYWIPLQISLLLTIGISSQPIIRRGFSRLKKQPGNVHKHIRYLSDNNWIT